MTQVNRKLIGRATIILAGVVVFFSLPLISTNFSVLAGEHIFECAEEGFHIPPIYLSIDANGDARVEEPIKVTVDVNDPFNDETQLRDPSTYRIAWKNREHASWNRQDIQFEKKGGGQYHAEATITVSESNVSEYEFRVETIDSPGNPTQQLSLCGIKDHVKVGLKPPDQRDKTTTYTVGCTDIASSEGALYDTHYSCVIGYNGDQLDATVQGTTCAFENESGNKTKCLADPNVGPGKVLCLPCSSAIPPEGQVDEARRRALVHGDYCKINVDEGLLCTAQLTYSCLQSSVVPTSPRCIGSNIQEGRECVIGERECSKYTGLYLPLRCTNTEGSLGRCEYATCRAGSYIIANDSDCATDLGVTGNAYCIGEGNDAACATEAELRDLLANEGFMLNLYTKFGEDRVRRSIERLEGFGVVDPGNVVDPDIPDPNPDPSTDFGIQNCPYSEGSGTAIKFKPQDGILAGTAEYDRQRAEHYQCITCVAGGNSWTAIGCIDVSSPEGIFTSLIRLGIGTMGGVALLRMIWLGIIMGQSDNDGKVKEAWQGILATLGGITVVVFSVLIIRIVAVNILNVVPPGFFGL